MANPLPPSTTIGTIGELLVQLRLLEYGVQAAPPIRDSGNDLVAIKGRVVKFVQVKTKLNGRPRRGKLPKSYDFVFLVSLKFNDGCYLHDQSIIEVVNNEGVSMGTLDTSLVDTLWTQLL